VRKLAVEMNHQCQKTTACEGGGKVQRVQAGMGRFCHGQPKYDYSAKRYNIGT
jgi:hypothetical protein